MQARVQKQGAGAQMERAEAASPQGAGAVMLMQGTGTSPQSAGGWAQTQCTDSGASRQKWWHRDGGAAQGDGAQTQGQGAWAHKTAHIWGEGGGRCGTRKARDFT